MLQVRRSEEVLEGWPEGRRHPCRPKVGGNIKTHVQVIVYENGD